jgi:glucokinase
MASVRDQAGGRGSFDAIVIGVPGRVDYCSGQLEYAPNLPSTWVAELSEEHLARYFDAPVFLANDADLAAVGEGYFGAGEPYTDVVYITISTGVGAAVVLDGQLLRGTRSLAEIGHTILALDHLDNGTPATAEHLSAGPALGRRADQVGMSARGADLVALVRAGDPAARQAWNETMRAAGAAVANLAHLFSPDVIVIGGGVGRNDTLVRDPVIDMLERHGPQDLATPIKVVQAILGDDPGLVGAAVWPLAIGSR